MSSFELTWSIGVDDIDELGHVSNLRYLSWVQEVAKRHSVAVGFDHGRYVELGAVFVVRRHELDYLLPAFEGERLTVRTHIATFAKVSCTRQTEMFRDERCVMRASTLWAFVSTMTGRPTRIPEILHAAFAA